MPVFHDVRLPEDIEQGVKGGPVFSTSINEAKSGFEQRNINWSQPRTEWQFGYGIDDRDAYEVIISFFRARRGMAHGFRFKDWSDFAMAKQTIGTGDTVEVAFQLIKTYDSLGPDPQIRNLTRPVNSAALIIYLNDVVQGAGFTVDFDTGIVTFAVAPGAGVVVAAECEFDNPVRFNTDELNLKLGHSEVGLFDDLKIIELRE